MVWYGVSLLVGSGIALSVTITLQEKTFSLKDLAARAIAFLFLLIVSVVSANVCENDFGHEQRGAVFFKCSAMARSGYSSVYVMNGPFIAKVLDQYIYRS